MKSWTKVSTAYIYGQTSSSANSYYALKLSEKEIGCANLNISNTIVYLFLITTHRSIYLFVYKDALFAYI